MKTYLKLITVLSITLLLSSYSSKKKNTNDKVIFTKMYVNNTSGMNLHESIIIYDNGNICYNKREGMESQTPIIGKLTNNQLFKLKKILNKSNFRYMNNSYKCNLEQSSQDSYLLFTINLPSIKKKIFIQEECNMPKTLKELDDYLINEISSKIKPVKN